MKKLFSMILAVVMCFSLVACAQEDTQQNEVEPQEETIEITIDNWQNYLEIKEYFDFYYVKNEFGEPVKANPNIRVLLTLKEEYRDYLYSDFAVEFNADYCAKDIVYNYDDFTFEIKDCESQTNIQIDESQFVRGETGTLMKEIIFYDRIVDNKVESEYLELDACVLYGIKGWGTSYSFRDNGDGTGVIEWYPVNIEITRIKGTLYSN